jgi:hypothetical protein
MAFSSGVFLVVGRWMFPGLAQSAALRLTSLAMPADLPIVPIYGRHFDPDQPQFITTSAYRHSPLFAR